MEIQPCRWCTVTGEAGLIIRLMMADYFRGIKIYKFISTLWRFRGRIYNPAPLPECSPSGTSMENLESKVQTN